MKHLIRTLLTLVALVGTGWSSASAEENYGLLFSFKTTLYQTAGAQNIFHFVIGATEDT